MPEAPFRLAARLADRSNRGRLLDLVVFLVNLLAMSWLMRSFKDLLRAAADDDPAAMAPLFGCAVALLVLAPLGATLSRWHYHQHRGRRAADIDGPVAGCVFNPIFYFCLAAVISAAVNAFLLQRLFGNRDPGGAVFAASLVIGIALIIGHTFLVYRYFSPPKQPPRSAFLRGPASAFLGDACLFANMLLFQLVWNAFTFAGVGPPGGMVEAVMRLALLCFLALLLYFPPRMFYLAEDIGRRGTWLSIMLANSPVIVRLLFGST